MPPNPVPLCLSQPRSPPTQRAVPPIDSCHFMRARRLFHVDDDELLYFNEPMNKIIARLPPEVSCVVLVNVEAVPKTLDADCVFSVPRPRLRAHAARRGSSRSLRLLRSLHALSAGAEPLADAPHAPSPRLHSRTSTSSRSTRCSPTATASRRDAAASRRGTASRHPASSPLACPRLAPSAANPWPSRNPAAPRARG